MDEEIKGEDRNKEKEEEKKLHYVYREGLKSYAKKLRKEMTSEERKLWFEFLRGLPVKVTRQKMIGKYIVDFYCAKEKIVIEVDGSQHYEDEGKATDEERDRYLFSMGIRVVRVPNREVNTNFRGVCDSLYQLLVKES